MTTQWRDDLQALQSVLERHANCLNEGDADALASLGASMRQILTRVARSCAMPNLPPEGRELLAQLSARTQRLQVMLARRALQVDGALNAMGSVHEGLRRSQGSRTYASGGAMSAGALHMRGFERA
ncbi:MAG: hypothetical protein H7255_08660 [Ramlibacter sp.]|nr:hypothetical protein [Ramlibacter sp.]